MQLVVTHRHTLTDNTKPAEASQTEGVTARMPGLKMTKVMVMLMMMMVMMLVLVMLPCSF